MKTLLQNYSLHAFMLILLGMGGCSGSSSTSPDSGEVRHGETSAGRSFTVLRDTHSGMVTLHIDGETPIHLNSESAEGVAADTIQVLEYSSPLHIVQATWEKATPKVTYSDYMFFEAGKASTPLIKGSMGYSSYDPAHIWVTTGAAKVSYDEGHVQITENVTRETRQEKCYADEKMLIREFNITNGKTQLQTCEERYRTKTLSFDSSTGCPDFSLNDAPWGLVQLSGEMWEQRCSAIRQSTYPPE